MNNEKIRESIKTHLKKSSGIFQFNYYGLFISGFHFLQLQTSLIQMYIKFRFVFSEHVVIHAPLSCNSREIRMYYFDNPSMSKIMMPLSIYLCLFIYLYYPFPLGPPNKGGINFVYLFKCFSQQNY